MSKWCGNRHYLTTEVKTPVGMDRQAHDHLPSGEGKESRWRRGVGVVRRMSGSGTKA
jgi:hypothetical protein